MLLENGGWASFNTTPRGKNHAYDLWELAQDNPKWFTQLLTIDDTYDDEGNPIVTEEMINELRKMGTDEETIQQEYYCSFEGSIQGAYYAQQIKALEDNNKVIDFPILPEVPVSTYWDIGSTDYTSIWFVQEVNGEYRLIDFWQGAGGDVPIFAKELQIKGYRYLEHNLPHDAGHLRVGMAGKTIKQH
jgi:phage terminase large subunit